MKRARFKQPTKSAADLMAELGTDPEYLARVQQQTQQRFENAESYRQAAEPILRELAASGINVQSLGEMRQMGEEYRAAVPIMVRWLPEIQNLHVKEDLVRTLSVPWAAQEAALPLIAEFKRTDNQSDGLRWAIANGLCVIATDMIFEQLLSLVTNKEYGNAREMLVVALGNCRDPRAVDVLTELLGDEQVVGHAVMALGRLRASTARAPIQALLGHPKAWVRTEATKALAAIDKRRP